jgi:NAD(P)-dependent dehydrogenase (short-subunit alcohol dehydrogenase family)
VDDMTVLDMFRLDGKVAVVTGASSGLGVSFAHALAEAGADVVLGARRVDRLDETKRLVESTGRRALAVQTDVADPEACQALVDAAMGGLGRVDVLVNNAGVGTDFGVAGVEPDFDAMGAVRRLDAEMGGWSPGYRISKAALNAMTRILSTELEDSGVKVNSACPGFVKNDGPTGGFFRDGKPVAF